MNIVGDIIICNNGIIVVGVKIITIGIFVIIIIIIVCIVNNSKIVIVIIVKVEIFYNITINNTFLIFIL